MTVTQSVVFKFSLFILTALFFTACTTGEVHNSESRKPQAAGYNRY